MGNEVQRLQDQFAVEGTAKSSDEIVQLANDYVEAMCRSSDVDPANTSGAVIQARTLLIDAFKDAECEYSSDDFGALKSKIVGLLHDQQQSGKGDKILALSF